MQMGNTLKISLGFGLPMLLTGAAFWLSSGWLTRQVFGQSGSDVVPIDTTGAQTVNVAFMVRVLAIDAEIDQNLQITEVSVQIGGSSLQEMEFKYPLADYDEIEQAIAQDLDILPETVRSLIRYRID
ncbi:hypothetical protein D0962_20970 [Leptolyngbyaceae cyanobacterium CCMR0082]|uniref:Uncharacterized protein n=2 Tax=Adonisia turfae TaxID=2950184 RepID=A0A6M0S9P1_9CYAN|nr:hypothetical protein [Adonisia turfae]MDV3347887.1 hypothetical protein [Leptothoe sp. LEGE 181152]NEZ58571.1 hypothetical protein [Adonisia turfae CCMR0081]NEZ65218.1 hypothetical protein [Adonisia turfae CCMR0082]